MPIDMTAPRVLRPHGSSPFVLFCDHASNYVPEELFDLGLEAADLERHIAWDIGAAGVTASLSDMFDAPAILCNTSRLVIDCNRQLNAADLIPQISDGTVIPGNMGLSEQDKADRIERWFRTYHDAIEAVLVDREERGVHTIAISIHSMTPNLAGRPRPWKIALSSYEDRSLTDPVLLALRRTGDILVGDNEPYALEPDIDYSIPYHAMRRGLPHLQVEFRQDEIAGLEGQSEWALRFAQSLPYRE